LLMSKAKETRGKCLKELKSPMKKLKITLITTIILISTATIICDIETRIKMVKTPVPVLHEPVSALLESQDLQKEIKSDQDAPVREYRISNASLKTVPIRKTALH